MSNDGAVELSTTCSDQRVAGGIPQTPAIVTVAHLSFFAIMGTLARLGLSALTSYPGAPVLTSLLWSNVAGSFIIGFLIENRGLPMATKRSSPLYIGLTVGFCGSLTSFSSFMQDAFLALANASPAQPHRSPGYSFMAVLAVIIITVGVCVAAFRAGSHLACILILPFVPLAPRLSNGLGVLLGLGTWAGAITMAIIPNQHDWRGSVLFALVFAPVGCVLRFYVSQRLNGRYPAGTLTVNILGSIVLAVCLDLQHAPIGNRLSCQILRGLMDGFCGCLTTVSTWIVELDSQSTFHAWVYGLISICAGLSSLVIISGSLLWTKGFQQPLCPV